LFVKCIFCRGKEILENSDQSLDNRPISRLQVCPFMSPEAAVAAIGDDDAGDGILQNGRNDCLPVTDEMVPVLD